MFGRHVGWCPDAPPLGNQFFEVLTSAVWHAVVWERVFVSVKEDVTVTVEIESLLVVVHFA